MGRSKPVFMEPPPDDVEIKDVGEDDAGEAKEPADTERLLKEHAEESKPETPKEPAQTTQVRQQLKRFAWCDMQHLQPLPTETVIPSAFFAVVMPVMVRHLTSQ